MTIGDTFPLTYSAGDRFARRVQTDPSGCAEHALKGGARPACYNMIYI